MTKNTAVRIKETREAKQWTQLHLAEAAGISTRTVQRIENGETPSKESLLSLAAAFDVEIETLISIPDLMDTLNFHKRRINKGILIHLGIWSVFTAFLLCTQPIYIERSGETVFNEIFYNSIGWGSGICLHALLAWGKFYYYYFKG